MNFLSMSLILYTLRLKTKVLLTTAILILLLGGEALALDPNRAITQYLLDVWQDELPQATVLTITQTQDGYMWFGTYEGLLRFDGVKFSVFNSANVELMKNNSVSALAEGSDGALWIGTRGSGVLRYSAGQFQSFKFSKEHTGNAVIWFIYSDSKGRIWLATDSGVTRVDGSSQKEYLFSKDLLGNRVTKIMEDPIGRVWISTGSGLNVVEGEAVRSYTVKDGLPSNLVRSVAAAASGQVWIATDKGLCYFQYGKFSAPVSQDPLLKETLGDISVDRNGNVWVGVDRVGLLRLTRDGRVGVLSKKEGFSDTVVRHIYEDRERSLWVGTTNGLNRLYDGRILTVTRGEGLLESSTRSVYEDEQGAVWIGTDGGGVARYFQGAITNITARDGLPSDLVRAVTGDRKGRIWVGTNNGLRAIVDGRVRPVPQGPDSDNIHAIYVDTQDNVWVGTLFNGVYRLGADRLEHLTVEDGLPSNSIRAICVTRDGAVWVGQTLARFKDGIWKRFDNKDVSGATVFSFYEEEDGTLWIGTSSGLYRYRNNRFDLITVRNGLFDNVAFQILEDRDQNFWMSCNRGVYRVSKRDLHECADGRLKQVKCRSFGKADGMRANQCNGATQPAGWKTRDGRLLFPTTRGIAVIALPMLESLPPPPVLIERVLVDDHIVLTQGQALQPGTGRFEFQFTALSYIAVDKVAFKFKLEGFDRDWNQRQTLRTAYYTNLKPGRYRFLVQACNKDGIWNEQGASFEFEVLTPIWQRWWAYLIYTLIGAGLFYLGTLARVRFLERRYQELERVASERTLEIARHRDVLEDQKRQILESIEYAERIQRSMLPMDDLILRNVADCFILYKPRDIISGDFYWFAEVDGLLILAVADCTGHGVPGALMSMIGTELLKQIVVERGVTEPTLVLELLNKDIRYSLRQNLTGARTDDGMDICFCSIDQQAGQVYFAGARRPLYYVNSDGESREIPGNRKSVGGRQKELKRTYEQVALPIGEGVTLYFTTDGFTDQPNPEGVKFGRRRWREFLARNGRLELDEQHSLLNEELTRHQQHEPQRDDITVMAVKILPLGDDKPLSSTTASRRLKRG